MVRQGGDEGVDLRQPPADVDAGATDAAPSGLGPRPDDVGGVGARILVV